MHTYNTFCLFKKKIVIINNKCLINVKNECEHKDIIALRICKNVFKKIKEQSIRAKWN